MRDDVDESNGRNEIERIPGLDVGRIGEYAKVSEGERKDVEPVTGPSELYELQRVHHSDKT